MYLKDKSALERKRELYQIVQIDKLVTRDRAAEIMGCSVHAMNKYLSTDDRYSPKTEALYCLIDSLPARETLCIAELAGVDDAEKYVYLNRSPPFDADDRIGFVRHVGTFLTDYLSSDMRVVRCVRRRPQYNLIPDVISAGILYSTMIQSSLPAAKYLGEVISEILKKTQYFSGLRIAEDGVLAITIEGIVQHAYQDVGGIILCDADEEYPATGFSADEIDLVRADYPYKSLEVGTFTVNGGWYLPFRRDFSVTGVSI